MTQHPVSAQAGRLPLVMTVAGLAFALTIQTAAAQGTQELAQPQQQASPPGGPTQPVARPERGFWDRGNLLGGIAGLRPWIDAHGISFGVLETSEVFGNPTGGIRQGVIYEGATELTLGIDTEKAFGFPGGMINASAFQIHGRGLTTNDIGSLNVVSSIEADRSTRLYELWYQQSFFGGRADVRVGQLAADQEFLLSTYSALFIDSTSFGWPTLPSSDLPSGGPAYPFGAPGVRLRVKPSDQLTLLAGIYSGDPAGTGTGDPQLRNASGARFPLDSGVFAIAELQYAINQEEHATGLPGTYKLGAWYDSERFADLRFDTSGALLGSPLSNGLPRQRRNNFSIYALADQLVYRPPGATDGGAGVFLRVMGAPGDRNLVNFFADAGITYKGLIPGRGNDTVGIGIGYTRISDAARKADAETALFTTPFPIRSSETVLEITYQAQIAPWWLVQPDFQYIINPGGGILNPVQPGKRIGDAAIFGMRTSIVF